MRESKGIPTGTSVDSAEVARFAALAGEWWAPDGKFAPLHRLNPVRLRFIRDRVALHRERDVSVEQPLKDIHILDIGCGGGLLCEPLSRLGARVTGIDAGAEAIAVARQHAADAGLTIDYRHTSAEELVATGERFDVVLAMELVEHVADPAPFIATAAMALDDDGMMILATLNRTPNAFLQAIVGAEYVLRWLPRGTHDWRKFLRPSELAAMARGGGLAVEEIVGLSYSPLTGTWRMDRDTTVNYMLRASKV